MNRARVWSSTAGAALGAALVAAAETPSAPSLLAAHLEAAAASARQSSVALTAWKQRDPDLFMSTVPRDFSLKRPDGTLLTWQGLHESTKARMAAVSHVDHFLVTIEVEDVRGDAAVVLSTQDWSRVTRGQDGKAVRLKTGVTHRDTWKRTRGQWKMEGFTEHGQTREQRDDVTIKAPAERYEIQIKLRDATDAVAIR
jgi:hypothetical protein